MTGVHGIIGHTLKHGPIEYRKGDRAIELFVPGNHWSRFCIIGHGVPLGEFHPTRKDAIERIEYLLS